MIAITWQKFTTATAAHYELLLDADPNRALVTNYVKNGTCFEARYQDELVGVLVVIATRPATAEIVNVAVKETFQGQGVGEQMVRKALAWCQTQLYQTVEIGTGSSSFQALYLYQKCGFRMTHIDRDFFVRHYNEEIIENKIVLRDMVRLSQDL